MEDLGRKTLQGVLWLFILRIFSRGFSFIRILVLARLLSPKDFGILGIALLIVATLESFSKTGIKPALIHQQGDIQFFLDTAWTINLMRGIVLFAAIFFSAPLVAEFFNTEEAEDVLRVISFYPLIVGCGSIGVLLFQKYFLFKEQFIYDFSAALIELIVAIGFAFLLKNVWALVYGILAGAFTRLILSYLLTPYRPKIYIDAESLRLFYSYGKWIFSSGILIFLLTQGDDIFLGKILGAEALGIYQMAYLISNLPATEITHLITQVTFPAYAKLQWDRGRFKLAFFKVLRLTTFFVIPLSAIILIVSPLFIPLFFGEKWLQMIEPIQILVIFGLTRAIGSTMGPIFLSVGKPQIQTKLSAIQLLFMVILIYPLTHFWGIEGTALSVVLPNFIALFLVTSAAKKILMFNMAEFIKILFPPFFAGILMVGFARLFVFELLPGPEWKSFILLMTFCIAVYLIGIKILDRDREIFSSICELTEKIWKRYS